MQSAAPLGASLRYPRSRPLQWLLCQLRARRRSALASAPRRFAAVASPRRLAAADAPRRLAVAVAPRRLVVSLSERSSLAVRPGSCCCLRSLSARWHSPPNFVLLRVCRYVLWGGQFIPLGANLCIQGYGYGVAGVLEF